MQLLNSKQVEQKIKRLAYEILEQHYDEAEIIIAGINNKGLTLARKLKRELDKIARKTSIRLTSLKLSPANPTENEIKIGIPLEEINDKVIIITDDVANTGRTMYYAIRPLLDILPKKVEFAVLVDRKHKSFPIKVDYVGMTLATTIQENIEVEFGKKGESVVMLD
ncbi:MAG: phosphoribosyltransferase family protein [Bacteroidota bacterium]